MDIDEKNSNIVFFKASVLLVSCKTEVAYNKLLLLSSKLNQGTLFFLDYIAILTKKTAPVECCSIYSKEEDLIYLLNFNQFNFENQG